jgi:acetyl-CoA carboxylase biotin carboxylase subunit
MLKKILIANRGEIAVRIIRACREMRIQSVAVFSEADRSALHVQMADEAVCIGPSTPSESYLNIEKILESAKSIGAEAIHPGYGFLAENYMFAAQCEKNELVFIGPGSKAIKLLGDKVASRRCMSNSGVKLIPGMKTGAKNIQSFKEHAEKIGYPVMIKASAGGGGKGMRVVRTSKKLGTAIEAGMREAKSAFGDERVYLEKFIEKPRHIEFQVLADHHGNIVHLFERECSIQRRHQKIVEETPSTVLDQELRDRMGRTAVEVVRASGYTNAGTVEFLMDEDKNYYFLEVNTRLQVEHPVTEMVTGIDLVKWQIRIAAGERLSFKQDDIQQNGHAIECRIYAEDPANMFMPSLGEIALMNNPEGPGVRVDSGIYSGYEVTRYYDPILAKLIVWGKERDIARKRMIDALSNYVIIGIKTTIPFLKDVMEESHFITGCTHTDFIDNYFPKWEPKPHGNLLEPALIAAAVLNLKKDTFKSNRLEKETASPWKVLGRWRIGNS